MILVSLLVTTPLASQSSDSAGRKDADGAVAGGGALPPGWIARPDADGDPKAIKFVIMEPGYHLTLGPATILYRKEDRVDGPFHMVATFHQMKKSKHPEGYGLFIGGRALEGPAQSYTYFLVREDGKFNIKRRDGEKLAQYTDGWEADPAVRKTDAKGASTNRLEIDAKSDPKRVSFKVNGKEVHWLPAHMMDHREGIVGLHGIVGLRVNHNLDLHVENLALHR
jgi:hypothetical protein